MAAIATGNCRGEEQSRNTENNSRSKQRSHLPNTGNHAFIHGCCCLLYRGIVDRRWLDKNIRFGQSKAKSKSSGWNKGKSFKEFGEKPNFLLIADDVVGGFFAINGGEFGQDLGQIYYLVPESLKWEALNITYLQFLNFCFAGDITKFYEDLRWKGWREEVKKLSPDQVFSFYPFLWTAEGMDIKKVSRKLFLYKSNTIFQ